MRNAYDHSYTKNPFLPLLCRVSIKDVKKLRDYKDPSASFSSYNDPSSPKVSCTGQVKKNNRLIGFSTTAKTNADHHHFIKYTKLRRLFSGKNLVASAPSAATAMASAGYGAGGDNARSCREIMMRRDGSRRSSKIKNDNGSDSPCHNSRNDCSNRIDVDISELDPPLPVIKKLQKQPCELSLWKRRSGGPAPKSLQI